MIDFENIPLIVPENGPDIKNAIIFLHGYGANGKDLINIGHEWKESLPNTIFISPNAPFTCDWGGDAYQWFELTSIAPEKIGEGLEKAGPFFNKFIEEVKLKFSLNDNSIVFFGFSQGAMMGLYHLCKRKKHCGGLLAYSGLLYENDEFESQINSKFPIRIFHGKDDEVVDHQYSLKSYEKLKSLGFDVELKVQDYLGHGIDQSGLSFGLKFVDKIFNI
tara:strand:+ start:430 stop:1086 length:657 start_codon:yes stop_codon:yes gene_type:complete